MHIQFLGTGLASLKFATARALTALSVTVLSTAALAQPFKLDYLGQQIVPTGTTFMGTTVGGLSGIDFHPATQRFVAISDDRSALNPARYYSLRLNLSRFARTANPGSAGVVFEAVTTIAQPAAAAGQGEGRSSESAPVRGPAFPTNGVDPESIRLHPHNGNLLWTNEGQRAAAGLQNPTVREMRPDGSHVREFALPARYLPVGSPAGKQPGDAGIYNNLSLESLAVSTDGRTLYTATENALVQDGPVASVESGSEVRILAFDLATGMPGAEVVYPVSMVQLAPQPAGGFATNGLVELLAIAPGELLALERSFAAGAPTPGVGPSGRPTGNSVRLFHVSLAGGTDVSGMGTLRGKSYTAVTKTLLLDLSELRHDDGTPLAVDNIEGISWGPPMADGRRSLILVSDNNFGAAQFTQFVALAFAPAGQPGAVSQPAQLRATSP